MVNRIIVSLLGFAMVFVLGCSLGPVSEKELVGRPGVRVVDPNEGGIQIEWKESRQCLVFDFVKKTAVQLPESCRVKYRDFYFDWLNMIAVPCRLPGGNEYTFLVDTGYPQYLVTNGLVVFENDLKVISDQITYKTADDKMGGFCVLPELHIGDATISNSPCRYLLMHWEWNVLGVPLWRQKGVLAGLSLLDDFSYLYFDNPNKELEMSVTKIFQPQCPDHWRTYPFTTGRDEYGDRRLIVTVPFMGEMQPIMFDTCGHDGLIVGPALWESIREKYKNIKTRKTQFHTGFYGSLPCRKAVVPELQLAGETIRNAEIIILDKDSFYRIGEGTFGMKYFKKTTVVLDFKNHLMWIKNR